MSARILYLTEFVKKLIIIIAVLVVAAKSFAGGLADLPETIESTTCKLGTGKWFDQNTKTILSNKGWNVSADTSIGDANSRPADGVESVGRHLVGGIFGGWNRLIKPMYTEIRIQTTSSEETKQKMLQMRKDGLDAQREFNNETHRVTGNAILGSSSSVRTSENLVEGQYNFELTLHTSGRDDGYIEFVFSVNQQNQTQRIERQTLAIEKADGWNEDEIENQLAESLPNCIIVN